jgi:hypothetical protein
MNKLSILAPLALAACSTPTVTKIQTVTVDVPVAVQPITAAQVPVPPAPLGKRPADARDALDVALGKVCEWIGYGLRADPLLRLSAGEKPQALEYPECRKR